MLEERIGAWGKWGEKHLCDSGCASDTCVYTDAIRKEMLQNGV